MCDVEIDADWILAQLASQDDKCFWTGQTIVWTDEPRHPWKISLDRRDPTVGYSKANTVLSAWCINGFRGRMTEEETRMALTQLKWMKEHE